MDDIVELTLLFDFYGSMLTKKQYDIFDMYYNQDFSLQEIAEQSNISRQTVFDTIKRSKTNLYAFEEKLSLLSKHLEVKRNVLKAITDIDEVLENIEKDSSNYYKLQETKVMLENIE